MIQRLKTKKFWISFVGIIIMLLQLFGVKVDVPYVNEVVNSICAVLILLGLLDPGNIDTSPSENETEGGVAGNPIPPEDEELPCESENTETGDKTI